MLGADLFGAGIFGMSDKKKYPRADALKVAEELIAALAPACERIAIAGSLRRRRLTVGDIELLFVPQLTLANDDLFHTVTEPATEKVIDEWLRAGVLSKRLSKTSVATWGPKNKLAVHIASGIPVDLFTTTLENWFMSLVIRTGPKELNLKLISSAADRGYQLHAYGTFTHIDSGLTVAVESEEEVFKIAGVPYIQPYDR